MDSLQWPAVAGGRTEHVESPTGSESPRPAPTRQLWGVAASAGFAGGRVRHVATAANATALGPHDVAVCPALTPALAAALGSVSAVVADVGGMLAAAATILRERGIPAVVTPGATTHLRPDQCVVVDGTCGTVWIGARLAPNGAATK